jgi:predicted deacylase
MTPNASPRIALAIAFAIAAALLPGCGTTPRPRPPAAAPPAATVPPPRTPPTGVWRTIGFSVERRPLLVSESGTGPLRIYLIGGVHGDETEGRSALQTLSREANAAATLRILRDLNPDGTAARRRVNARGYDLNRNWPATNVMAGPNGGPAPLSEPETRALEQDLRAFRPDIVVVLHSIGVGPLVNYDGPADRLAAAFVDAARTIGPDWHVRPVMGYDTSGSLGSYLGVDRKLPILTIEMGRGQDEASATAALRQGLAATIRAADVPRRGGDATGGPSPAP